MLPHRCLSHVVAVAVLAVAEDVLKELNVGHEGLSTAQAQERLEQYGHNKLKEAEKPTMMQRFIAQLKDPMLIILLIAAAVSAATNLLAGENEMAEVIIILAVVLLNAVLGVLQEESRLFQLVVEETVGLGELEFAQVVIAYCLSTQHVQSGEKPASA